MAGKRRRSYESGRQPKYPAAVDDPAREELAARARSIAQKTMRDVKDIAGFVG